MALDFTETKNSFQPIIEDYSISLSPIIGIWMLYNSLEPD